MRTALATQPAKSSAVSSGPAKRPASTVASSEHNPLWSRLATSAHALPISADPTVNSVLHSASPHIQTKLTVGAPDDPLEREADRVADAVMRMPDPGANARSFQSANAAPVPSRHPVEDSGPTGPFADAPDASGRTFPLAAVSLDGVSPVELRRKCAHCEEEERETLHRKTGASTSTSTAATADSAPTASSSPSSRIRGSANSLPAANAPAENQDGPEIAPPIVHEVLRSPGQPLDASTRAFFEPRFGRDFSDVRVHTGSLATESAQAVHALAYAVGTKIVLGNGSRQLDDTAQQRLVAHELAHVSQHNSRMLSRLWRSCGANAIGSQAGCVGRGGDITEFGGDSGLIFRFGVGCDEFLIGEEDRVRDLASSLSVDDKLEIDGFSSEEGSPTFNEDLSCARAKALESTLLAAGFFQDRIIGLYKHGGTPGVRSDRRSAVVTLIGRPVEPVVEQADSRVCGPNITAALSMVLGDTESYFRSLSWFEKRRSCMGLDIDAPLAFVNPVMAWDVIELYLPNTSWLDAYFRNLGCGSPRDRRCESDPTRSLCETRGTCGNTVEVGGKCMLAGTANYALYGKLFRMCNDEFWPDYPRWDMRAMIRLWKAFGSDDVSPPLAMASAAFDGTLPSVPASAENRRDCTGRCSLGSLSGFDFVWEPYRSR